MLVHLLPIMQQRPTQRRYSTLLHIRAILRQLSGVHTIHGREWLVGTAEDEVAGIYHHVLEGQITVRVGRDSYVLIVDTLTAVISWSSRWMARQNPSKSKCVCVRSVFQAPSKMGGVMYLDRSLRRKRDSRSPVRFPRIRE
jgi:hypothetical protein